VPAAERESIWRPFQRGSAARDGAGGSGIGLTIVKEIVDEHRGRVWVEDGAAGGAAFVVELPATDTSSPADADLAAPSVRSTQRPARTIAT
jgi:two-component system OmpR family sensor kinase